MIENHILDAILTLLGIGATSFIGFVAHAVTKFIVHKHLEGLAKTAVRFAQDAFKNAGGDEKLAQACKWLANQLHTFKLTKFITKNITAQDIENYVHAAYIEIKHEFAQDLSQAQVKVSLDGEQIGKTTQAKQVANKTKQ